jgi:hypothetical protein
MVKTIIDDFPTNCVSKAREDNEMEAGNWKLEIFGTLGNASPPQQGRDHQ